MTYPFDDSPIDEYLHKLSTLKLLEFEARCTTLNVEASAQDKLSATNAIRTLNEEIRSLRLEYQLPERTFDRYKSSAELAVERFEREHPEPPIPKIYDCQHLKTQTTKRTFRNGAVHVVLQCLDCGRQPKAMSKIKHNLDILPEFDERLDRRLTAERTLWEEARRAVYEEEMRKHNNLPEYDRSAFEETFQQRDPAPCLKDCNHNQTEARIRTYSTGATAVVLQCTKCGHHTGASSKRKHPQWESLPPFDEFLTKQSKGDYKAWLKRKYEAGEIDHQDHKNSIQDRIQKNELTWKDNSRFGTYYESPEWERTRSRILRRDDYQCQTCDRTAECVHHILYDRLGAENDFDLISLCHTCHELVHQEQRKNYNLLRMSPSLIRSMLDPDKNK